MPVGALWFRLAVLSLCLLGSALAQVEQDPAAKVIELLGQVSILRDGQPWALNVGQHVRPRQLIVTGADGYALLRLTDGSTFEVFPNSKVTFRDNPGSLRDLLDLWLGRVKVHIQHMGGKPNPNRIKTPTALISVRGTTFDVTVEDDEGTTLVTVEEGQVAVQHALRPSGDPKVVNGGEELRVYRNQPLTARRGDKGTIVRRAIDAAADALNTAIYRGGLGGGRSGGGIGSTTPRAPSGDTGGQAPPPPAPPPPAPPGPPPGN